MISVLSVVLCQSQEPSLSVTFGLVFFFFLQIISVGVILFMQYIVVSAFHRYQCLNSFLIYPPYPFPLLLFL